MVALSGNSFKTIGSAANKFFSYEIPDVLSSEKVRNVLGTRLFDFNAGREKENLLKRLGDLFPWLGGINSKYGNFIGGVWKFLGAIWEKTIGWMIPDFSISNIWDFIVEGYFELKNFNWNQTDKELEEAVKQTEVAIQGARGALDGTAIVWGLGVAITAGVAIKWPVIAADMALEVADEGSSEIAARIGSLMQTIFRSQVNSAFIGALLTARRLELFGQKSIYAFQNKKPWTIADEIDNRIDKIKDPGDRAYWRSWIDAVEDSIIDMGYVMAFSLDDHFQNQQYADLPPPDSERAIRLYLDQNPTDDQTQTLAPPANAPYIYLEGDQDEVIAQAEDAMLTHAVLGEKDIGEFMGIPYDEWQRATPKRANLQIRYYDTDKPPFRKAGATQAVFNIPDPKPLTWEKVKQAAISYTSGPVLTTIRLDNGRQMQCWASTETEGLNTLKRLLELSNARMVGFPAHTKIDDSLLPPGEKRRNRQMHAAFGTYTIARSTKGITDPSYLHAKNKKWAKNRFKIWVATEAESGFKPPLSN